MCHDVVEVFQVSEDLLFVDVVDGRYCSVFCSIHLSVRIKKRMKEGGRKEMFYLTMHSTHFLYGYMVSYIW